jgi:ABC-type transport system substrate-binding protein
LKKSVVCILLVTLILLSSFTTMTASVRPVLASTSRDPVLGIVTGPVPTFLENYQVTVFVGGEYDTQLPYEPMSRSNGTGAIVPNIVKFAFVPGTNDTKAIANLVDPNRKWSDGVPITSDDLYYSIDMYLPTGTYANTTTDILKHIVQYVTDVQIRNSTAVQVTLNAALPQISISFKSYPVYPAHYYKTLGIGNLILDRTPVLAGP